MRIIIYSFLLLSCCTQTQVSSSPNGIGPIENLQLAAISDSLTKIGMEVFTIKCSNCHTMEYKNKGPDISDLLAYRQPEWFMNFMLNTEQMLMRDSLALTTRAQYSVDCNPGIQTKQEARALLDYLRMYQLWLHEINAK